MHQWIWLHGMWFTTLLQYPVPAYHSYVRATYPAKPTIGWNIQLVQWGEKAYMHSILLLMIICQQNRIQEYGFTIGNERQQFQHGICIGSLCDIIIKICSVSNFSIHVPFTIFVGEQLRVMLNEGLFFRRGNLIFIWFFGPILEVLQYQANPWRSRSKPLCLLLGPKISLISKYPGGVRIRY